MVQTFGGTARRFVKSDDTVGVEMSLEPRFDWARKNIELSSSLSTSSSYTLNLIMKDWIAKGTRFTSVLSLNEDGGQLREVAQYKGELVSTKASYAQHLTDDAAPTNIEAYLLSFPFLASLIRIHSSIAAALINNQTFAGLKAAFGPFKDTKLTLVEWGAKLGVHYEDFQVHAFAYVNIC